MIEHTCRESYFDAIKVDWNWYVFRFCEISTLPLLHSSLRSSTFFFCCHPCSRSDPFSSSVSALQCKCCCTERLSRTVSPTDARQWRLAGTNCCRWEYSRRTLQDTMYSSLPKVPSWAAKNRSRQQCQRFLSRFSSWCPCSEVALQWRCISQMTHLKVERSLVAHLANEDKRWTTVQEVQK